jgi:redox-sensitive bicupin YhaK (pirin superfamily)
MSIDHRRADARFVTDQPGIRTWHCFSSGAHYDPDNVAFGPLIAVDWHRVDPGAGFTEHRHRDVEIVTVVLSGTLRHAGTTSGTHDIPAGRGQYQSAGSGIVHSEMNASPTDAVEFVQVWVRPDQPGTTPAYAVVDRLDRGGTVAVDEARWLVSVGRWSAGAARAFVLALSDGVRVSGRPVSSGDQVRLVDEWVELSGPGRALVWLLPD